MDRPDIAARHPIETAPRNGLTILVSAEDVGEFAMSYDMNATNDLFPGELGFWVDPMGHFTWRDRGGEGPTHWRPMP